MKKLRHGRRPMGAKHIRLLLVEDDAEQASFLSRFLAEPNQGVADFALETASHLSSALDQLARAAFDIVLLDLGLPDSHGIETFIRVASAAPRLPIIAFTGLGDERLALETMGLGAQDYLVKGSFTPGTLRRAIMYAIERKRLARQFEDLIARNADGMVVIDAQGCVRYVNPAAERLLGQAAARLVGKPFDFPAIPEQSAELKFPAADGTDKIAEMRTTEIQWQGQPACLASIRDITELRHLERLKAEVKEHRRLDKLKDELITSVSTELRAPLTVLYGSINNLLRGVYGTLTEAQAKAAAITQRGAERLVKSVNNILEISQLESGHTYLHLEPLAVPELFHDAIGVVSIEAARRNVLIETQIQPELPRIEADRELMEQVLRQLLDNALRYCKRRIVLGARRIEGLLPAGENSKRNVGLGITVVSGRRGVEISVSDDGPGIPKEKLSLLFRKFAQVRPEDRNGPNGTGLGLEICREIVQCHHGKVWVENTEGPGGSGADFHFVIPEYERKFSEERSAKPRPRLL